MPDQVFWFDYYWVYLFASPSALATTIAEPSLLAVAIKANEVSAGAIGVTGLRSPWRSGGHPNFLGCYRIGGYTHSLLYYHRVCGGDPDLFAPKLIVLSPTTQAV